MSDGKQAGPDASFRTSVLQNVGGAFLLVVLVAGVFWAIGMVGRADDDALVAADVPEDGGDAEDADVEVEDDDPPADPDPDADGPDAGGDDDASSPDGDDTGPDTDVSDGDGDTGEDDASDGDAEPEPEPEPIPPAIPPGDISVQVLDGYQVDGGAAAAAVAAELEEAGYRIVARNPALRYEVTTVLWTAGSEDAGRQVAAEIGAAEVREQSGNLSNAVAVHVVVGADRG